MASVSSWAAESLWHVGVASESLSAAESLWHVDVASESPLAVGWPAGWPRDEVSEWLGLPEWRAARQSGAGLLRG